MEDYRCDDCKKAEYQCEACTRYQLSRCNCGSGLQRYELCDCWNIFVTYVCEECEHIEAKRYNLVYSQADIDEPIEEEW